MSLQIVTGSSGAGKSYTIYKELIDVSMAHPEKQYLVIVPEQFTMQAQKELVRMHPRQGLLTKDSVGSPECKHQQIHACQRPQLRVRVKP